MGVTTYYVSLVSPTSPKTRLLLFLNFYTDFGFGVYSDIRLLTDESRLPFSRRSFVESGGEDGSEPTSLPERLTPRGWVPGPADVPELSRTVLPLLVFGAILVVLAALVSVRLRVVPRGLLRFRGSLGSGTGDDSLSGYVMSVGLHGTFAKLLT